MCSPYKTNWPALNHLKLLDRSFPVMQTRYSLLALVVFMVFLDMRLHVRYDRNLFYKIAHAQYAPTNIVLLYIMKPNYIVIPASTLYYMTGTIESIFKYSKT